MPPTSTNPSDVDFFKKYLPSLVVLGLILAVALWVRGRPSQAEVVHPKVENLSEILAASGQVRGKEESKLAPEVAGTVAEINIEEGDKVKKGQVLARLDTGRLEAAVQQATERVRVARAQLDIAGRKPLPAEFEELRSQNRQAEEKATAALESARQQLLESQRGPRVEQIRQARADLAQAQADSDQKARDLVRQQELYSKGAISKQAYEQSHTLASEASAARERAQQRLDELTNGTRPEQLERNQQAVASAQADLEAAKSTGAARMQQLQDRPRPEDVELARAQVQEAQAALTLAKKQKDQAQITAPYDGTVGRKLLRPGDPAGPNAPILTIASAPALEIRVELDESERSRVKKNMKAEVRAGGYDKPFTATVQEFAGEIDSVKGTLEARLQPSETPSWLLPGQTVDVNIILKPPAERMIIPLTCVMLEADSASVYVVEDGKIKRAPIKVSSPSQSGYLVSEGLQKSDTVVMFPQSFKEGQRVRLKLTDF